MNRDWHVLFVKTGEEEKIARALRKEKLDAFVPKMNMMYRKQGESLLVAKTMFPGYVFIECEMNQADLLLFLKDLHERVPKFMKLLKVDKEGTSVLYPDEKEYMQSLLNENHVLDHSVGLIEGDKAIITEGPLKGLENTILKIDRHKRRALIEVMICNVPTQVKVSLEIISKT